MVYLLDNKIKYWEIFFLFFFHDNQANDVHTHSSFGVKLIVVVCIVTPKSA